MERVIRVVYEDGVLKPLQHLQLGERAICLVSLYPEEKWLKDFQNFAQTHSATVPEKVFGGNRS